MNLCKLSTFIFLCFACNSYSQNLVPNGSFEEVINCPQGLGDIANTVGWYGSIQVPGVPMNENPSPDWYHTCSTSSASIVPDNAADLQWPFSDGNGYAGIIIYATTPMNVREYLGVELIEPIAQYNSYNVELKVVKADNVNFYNSSNNLGVKFSNQETYDDLDDIMNNTAHFSYPEIILDSVEWVTLSFNFIADSNYSYLHIGNFFSDEFTNHQVTNSELNKMAYYFIDEVSIVQIGWNSVENSNPNNISIFPNPANEFIRLDNIKPNSRIELYNLAGQKVFENVSDNDEFMMNLNDWQSGVYFIKLTDQNNYSQHYKILKI